MLPIVSLYCYFTGACHSRLMALCMYDFSYVPYFNSLRWISDDIYTKRIHSPCYFVVKDKTLRCEMNIEHVLVGCHLVLSSPPLSTDVIPRDCLLGVCQNQCQNTASTQHLAEPVCFCHEVCVLSFQSASLGGVWPLLLELWLEEYIFLNMESIDGIANWRFRPIVN